MHRPSQMEVDRNKARNTRLYELFAEKNIEPIKTQLEHYPKGDEQLEKVKRQLDYMCLYQHNPDFMKIFQDSVTIMYDLNLANRRPHSTKRHLLNKRVLRLLAEHITGYLRRPIIFVLPWTEPWQTFVQTELIPMWRTVSVEIGKLANVEPDDNLALKAINTATSINHRHGGTINDEISPQVVWGEIGDEAQLVQNTVQCLIRRRLVAETRMSRIVTALNELKRLHPWAKYGTRNDPEEIFHDRVQTLETVCETFEEVRSAELKGMQDNLKRVLNVLYHYLIYLQKPEQGPAKGSWNLYRNLWVQATCVPWSLVATVLNPNRSWSNDCDFLRGSTVLVENACWLEEYDYDDSKDDLMVFLNSNGLQESEKWSFPSRFGVADCRLNVTVGYRTIDEGSRVIIREVDEFWMLLSPISLHIGPGEVRSEIEIIRQYENEKFIRMTVMLSPWQLGGAERLHQELITFIPGAEYERKFGSTTRPVLEWENADKYNIPPFIPKDASIADWPEYMMLSKDCIVEYLVEKGFMDERHSREWQYGDEHY